MLISRETRHRAIAVIAMAAVVTGVTTTSASAATKNLGSITCTSSTGHAVLIGSSARGWITHRAGALEWTKGSAPDYTKHFTNTRKGGTIAVKVRALSVGFDSGLQVTGHIKSAQTRCGTSSSTHM